MSTHKGRYNSRNLGLVTTLEETLFAYALGEERGIHTGVVQTCPLDGGVTIEDSYSVVDDKLALVVESVDHWAILEEYVVEIILEEFLLLRGNRHKTPEAKLVAEELLVILPLALALGTHLLHSLGELHRRATLLEEHIHTNLVVVPTERHTTCLVVGSHNDEGLVGVLLCKIESKLNSLSKLAHLVEGGNRILLVSRIVELTALNHQEEAILRLALEVVECRLRVVETST